MRSGVHAIPKDIGVYPYIEAEASESLDHRILTICTAQREGKEHGKVSHTESGAVWTVKIEHNGQTKTVQLNGDEELPAIMIT